MHRRKVFFVIFILFNIDVTLYYRDTYFSDKVYTKADWALFGLDKDYTLIVNFKNTSDYFFYIIAEVT